jgi:hypothetical protein
MSDDLKCKYCGKEMKSKSGKTLHEKKCAQSFKDNCNNSEAPIITPTDDTENCVPSDGKPERFYNDQGKLHKEDGPAIIWPDGHMEWWLDGKKHRNNGPAICHRDGLKEWDDNGNLYEETFYLHGNRMTEDEFMEAVSGSSDSVKDEPVKKTSMKKVIEKTTGETTVHDMPTSMPDEEEDKGLDVGSDVIINGPCWRQNDASEWEAHNASYIKAVVKFVHESEDGDMLMCESEDGDKLSIMKSICEDFMLKEHNTFLESFKAYTDAKSKINKYTKAKDKHHKVLFAHTELHGRETSDNKGDFYLEVNDEKAMHIVKTPGRDIITLDNKEIIKWAIDNELTDKLLDFTVNINKWEEAVESGLVPPEFVKKVKDIKPGKDKFSLYVKDIK